jgi:hypothetical protein
MKCSKIQSILLDYAYGELEPADAVKVEEHVRGCTECAAQLHDIEFTSKAFKKAESRVPSNHAVENIFRAASEALNKEEPEEARIIHLFSRETVRPFLVGAASVLLIIGTIMLILGPHFTLGQPSAPMAAGTVKETVPGNPLPASNDVTLVGAKLRTDSIDTMFSDAEELFKQKHYESALLLYSTIYRGAPQYKHEMVREKILKILDFYRDNSAADQMRNDLLNQP